MRDEGVRLEHAAAGPTSWDLYPSPHEPEHRSRVYCRPWAACTLGRVARRTEHCKVAHRSKDRSAQSCRRTVQALQLPRARDRLHVKGQSLSALRVRSGSGRSQHA